MRELDVLLGRWLEHSWPEASPEFRQSFARLLECEDDQIWDWLMGRAEPAPELAALVDEIRSQAQRYRA
jgi:antitoxin CptB